MLAGLAVALVLSSPVPLPKPVAGPPAAPIERHAEGPPAGANALAVPLPPVRPPAGETMIAAPNKAGEARRLEPAPDLRDARGHVPAPAAAHPAGATPVPVPRPGPAPALAAPAAAGAEARSPSARIPRPAVRSGREAPIVRAMLAQPGATRAPGPRGLVPPGMVCRDPRIVGEPAASFAGNIPGCGILDPVRVASISGVRLSGPITVDCRTARAVADWLTGVAQPAAREALGSGISSVAIMGSYSCRTRNNRPGERLSEHSVGRAVDVGGVRLADGRQISVRDHWNLGAPGAFLRLAWKGACGRFTTVIGPDGDRHHQDHLHLDTAYRDGAWCR